MGYLHLMGIIASQKFNALTTKQVKPVRTPTPLGMHQGSAVDAPILPITLAQLDGSVMPMPREKMSVTSVGVTKVSGYPVFRSYLSDGVSFYQIVADPTDKTKALEVKFFTSRFEKIPGTKEEWIGLLGCAEEKDEAGNVIVAKEDGLIGWMQFQLDGEPPVIYDRTWKASGSPVEAEISEEIIYSPNGTTTTLRHRAMEYGRVLGTAPDAPSEYLLASVIESKSPSGDDEAAFDVFIGISVVISDLKVLAAA